MRNSVKATVDAYDGTVTLYAWDDQDPLLKAWSKAFHEHRAPDERDQRRPDVAPALPRGPVQGAARRCWRQYHVTDAASFYGGQDFWQSRTTRPRTAQRRPAAVLPDPEDAGAGRARGSR